MVDSELLLVILIAIISTANLFLSLDGGYHVMRLLSNYRLTRQSKKIEPYHERVKKGFTLLDQELMIDNNLIAFMFEATEYVWDNIIPRVAIDLSPDEQCLLTEYLVENFNSDIFLNRIALHKDVVAKQLNN